jgi:serine/threonine protein kinase/tetratricopeptide (TPR) repeat protein
VPFRIQALVGVSEAAPYRLGRYDLVELLGRGGMGMVFAARERDTGLEVAIKLMTWHDTEAERRFREEFRAACEVRHENLVRLHELASDDGVLYFSMELVRGVDIVAWARQGLAEEARGAGEPTPPPTPSLVLSPASVASASVASASSSARGARRPWSQRPVPEDKPLRDVLAQLVRGVDALHARGILHLDLKPSNVLVTKAGRVVILDFGLSRPSDRAVTESNLLRGTPAYMAPEQVGGLALTPAADLYGVGGILYEMLTGVMPFEGWGTSALVTAKATLSIDPPGQVAPGTPPELGELALALLAPEPAKRPDAAAALAALGAPVRVRPPSLGGPVVRSFLGRERELETLRRAASDSRALRCLVLATLEGPSGIGKSALVAELTRHLSQEGWFYGGRCYEREHVPYKGVDEIVAGLARHLRRLDVERLAHYLPSRASELLATFPVLAEVRPLQTLARSTPATGDPHESRRAAWESLAEIFRAMATRRPLALFVDDVQWVDAQSIELLDFLAERLAGTMAFLLLARRDDGRSPAIRAPMEVSLTLGPLESAPSLELARVHLRALGGDEDHAARIADDAAGVPIHLEELSRYAAGHGASATRAAESSLAALLRDRIATLEPEARSLLATLALADAPLPQGLALSATGLAPTDHPVLSDLVSRRLARTTANGVMPHHDRVRETMRALLGEEEALARHLALARALFEETPLTGARAFAVVQHFAAAAPLEEADRRRAMRAARVAADAGRAAGTLELASEAIEKGLTWSRDDDWASHRDLVVAILTRGADLAFLAGRLETALEHVARLEASPATPLEKVEAREVALGVYIAQNRLADAGALTRRTLSELGHALPEVLPVVTFDLPAIEALRSLPLCTNPSAAAASRILQRAFSIFYTTDPLLRVAFGIHLVSLALENGVMPSTPMALAVAATTLNDAGREDLGHALSTVARETMARVGERGAEIPARVALDLFADVWVPSLFTSISRLRDDVVAGRRQLDVEYAARAASGFFRLGLYAGLPLRQLLGAHREWSGWLDPLQALPGHGLIRLNLHVVRAFAGEGPALPTPESGLDPFSNLGAVDALSRGMLEVHFGTLAEALEALDLAWRARPFLGAHWHVVALRQYHALVALDCDAPHAPELVSSTLEALRHWVEVSPTNFAHRLAMLEAELARRGGAGPEAYARAAELAERGGWLHDLGVIHERAGRREAAIDAYERWGAHAKVRRLAAGAPLWAPR